MGKKFEREYAGMVQGLTDGVIGWGHLARHDPLAAEARRIARAAAGPAEAGEELKRWLRERAFDATRLSRPFAVLLGAASFLVDWPRAARALREDGPPPGCAGPTWGWAPGSHRQALSRRPRPDPADRHPGCDGPLESRYCGDWDDRHWSVYRCTACDARIAVALSVGGPDPENHVLTLAGAAPPLLYAAVPRDRPQRDPRDPVRLHIQREGAGVEAAGRGWGVALVLVRWDQEFDLLRPLWTDPWAFDPAWVGGVDRSPDGTLEASEPIPSPLFVPC